VSLWLNLSDRVVDIAGERFDCAVRVGDLPVSSLVSVRLVDNRRLCVATPAYLKRAVTPQHPGGLARHAATATARPGGARDDSPARAWFAGASAPRTSAKKPTEVGSSQAPEWLTCSGIPS
jgi:hypothetical protein